MPWSEDIKDYKVHTALEEFKRDLQGKKHHLSDEAARDSLEFVGTEYINSINRRVEDVILRLDSIVQRRSDLEGWARTFLDSLAPERDDPARGASRFLYAYDCDNFGAIDTALERVERRISEGWNAVRINEFFAPIYARNYVVQIFNTPENERLATVSGYLEAIVKMVSSNWPLDHWAVTQWSEEFEEKLKNPRYKRSLRHLWHWLMMCSRLRVLASPNVPIKENGLLKGALRIDKIDEEWFPTSILALVNPPESHHHHVAHSLGRSFVISRRQAQIYQLD